MQLHDGANPPLEYGETPTCDQGTHRGAALGLDGVGRRYFDLASHPSVHCATTNEENSMSRHDFDARFPSSNCQMACSRRLPGGRPTAA
jgi:hypothetical protein